MSGGESLLGLSQRQPPANIAAEQSLLGSLLGNNNVYERVATFLRAEHFADPIHGRVYTEIERKIGAGQLADAVTLRAAFENSGVLTEVGGTAYLAQLLAATVAPLMVPDYARAIHDCWLRRQMIDMGEELVNAAFGADAGCDAADLVNAVQDRIGSLASAHASPATASSMMIGEAIRRVEHRASLIHRGVVTPSISTGLPSLDDILGGGIEPATFTVMGGMQESGKTELLLQIMENVALDQLALWQQHRQGPCPCVLIFEFEMKAEQLAARTAARLGGMSRRDLRRGRMTDAVTDGFRRLEEINDLLPIRIEAMSPASLGRFRSSFRSLLRQRPIVAVGVDNITRMADALRMKDQAQAYAEILTEFDNAAKTTGVPIIALAHILKSASSRVDGRPAPDDLPYNTGRYPDKAFIVHRPEKSLPPLPPEQGRMSDEAYARTTDEHWKRKAAAKDVTEIIPAKSREDDGERRHELVRLRFDRERARFVDPREVVAPEMPEEF